MEALRILLKNQYIDVIDEREAISSLFLGLLRFSVKVLTFAFIAMLFFAIIASDFEFKGDLVSATVIIIMFLFMSLLNNKAFREIMLFRAKDKA